MTEGVSKIGFNYGELTIANVLYIIFASTDVPRGVQLNEAVNVAKKCGMETTPETMVRAMIFVDRLRKVYAAFDPVLQIVAQLLESPEYFPEDPEDFETVVFGHQEEITEDRTNLLAAHSELLAFWQSYVMHRQATAALAALGAAYGAQHTRVFTDEEYPCLYHRGMTDVSLEIQRIVDIYNHYKDALGFTPAVLTPNHSTFPDVPDLLFDVVGDLTVNIPTLGGRIWFDGVPNQDEPGAGPLKGV